MIQFEQVTYIESHRDTDKCQVQMVEGDILLESVLDETSSHKSDKVKIQTYINNTEDGLFSAIPDVVDVFPCLVDLKPSRDPNDENANVDDQDDGEDGPFQSGDLLSVDN